MYYPDGLESLLDALGDEPMLPLTEFITEGRRALSVSEIHAVSSSSLYAYDLSADSTAHREEEWFATAISRSLQRAQPRRHSLSGRPRSGPAYWHD